MRLFVSLSVADKLADELDALQNQLKKRWKDKRIVWMESGWHVTVFFFEDIVENRISLLKSVFEREAAEIEPFRMTVGNLDAFPHPANPKTIIVPVKGEDDRANVAREKIAGMLLQEGFAFDQKSWKPHFTLGRVKEDCFAAKFPFWQAKQIDWAVDRLQLFSSDLRQDGAVHDLLGEFYFKKCENIGN